MRLEGTNQVDYTENDGSFRFNNVPGGQATISVTYTGYNAVKESFTVTPGQIATREIILTSTAAGATTKDGVVQLTRPVMRMVASGTSVTLASPSLINPSRQLYPVR